MASWFDKYFNGLRKGYNFVGQNTPLVCKISSIDCEIVIISPYLELSTDFFIVRIYSFSLSHLASAANGNREGNTTQARALAVLLSFASVHTCNVGSPNGFHFGFAGHSLLSDK